MQENLYLWIDLLSLAGPLLLSFDKKVAFWRTWKYLFAGILLMMAVFIPWDVAFTHHGIWGFNARYLSGIWVAGLPLEEWLFFIVVPYACVFIYACLNGWFPHFGKGSYGISIAKVLGPTLLVVGIFSFPKLYTGVTFTATGVLFSFLGFYLKPWWLSKFFNAYAICLLPFFVVNGVLTGTGIEEQIVWYNDVHNLGLRLFTIPADDLIYNLLMLLLVVWTMEALRMKKEPTFSR